ncbi:hypothetical protein [Vibrio phage JSF7]|uniref:Uncharacterized protein n=1 Tax=Vibrio phage JSF7 TaxID=1292086 RepID=A0A240EWW4_9CAUD|nr:hypothetical protein HOQ92_gp33 [Vibrio phage JSF7]APD18157.1 hypothetical protein [Vibrio phage JSF7]
MGWFAVAAAGANMFLGAKSGIHQAAQQGYNEGYSSTADRLSRMDEAAAQLDSAMGAISTSYQNKILTDLNIEQKRKEARAEAEVLMAMNGTTGAASSMTIEHINAQANWAEAENDDAQEAELTQLYENVYGAGGALGGAKTPIRNMSKRHSGGALGGITALLGVGSLVENAFNKPNKKE